MKYLQVACRQLGYVYGHKKDAPTDPSGKIWLDRVLCNSRETHLKDCYHRPWGDHRCYQNQDVGIECLSMF